MSVATTASEAGPTRVSLLDQVSSWEDVDHQRYLVELTFNNAVLGGQPRSEELIRGWITSRLQREAKIAEKKGLQPPDEARKQELIQLHLDRHFGAPSVEETIEEEEKRAWTTFFTDEIGPYIGVYQVKACIRDMMSQLGITKKNLGSRDSHGHMYRLRAVDLDWNVLPGVQGERLHFFRDGAVVEDVDGYVDQCAHIKDQNGRRSALKRHDKVVGASVRFIFAVPAGMHASRGKALIRDEDVTRIFHHAENNALGTGRSTGGGCHGTFRVTVLDKLTDNPWTVRA